MCAAWQPALAVGASIAPTSFAFSAKLFMEVGHLHTPLAQIACCAGAIDDMLSLVLLSGMSTPPLLLVMPWLFLQYFSSC